MKSFVNSDDNGYSVGYYMEEVGEMMNTYGLSTEDLQEIVDTYPNDWDVNKYVAEQLKFELEEQKETEKINNLLKNSGVTNTSKFHSDLKQLGYKISLY